MINFDSLTLKALIDEIGSILTEGRVQKVQQPSKDEVLLTIRALRETRKLYICTNPKYPHICFLSQSSEEMRNIDIPKKPPMFCMLLRKHLEGAKIKTFSQPGFERILEIGFDSYNELGERTSMVLSCEFMGKNSNIILYNYDNNVIQGCAHFVSEGKSRERELAGGFPYIYPPKQNKTNIYNLSKDDFWEKAKIIDAPVNIWLNKTFGHISMAFANELCDFLDINTDEHCIQAIKQEKIYELWDLISNTISFNYLNPSISTDKELYSLTAIDKNRVWTHYNSVNEMIDLYFGNFIFQEKFSRLKNNLAKSIKKELKKQHLQLSQYEKTLISKDKQENYRHIADVITANLYKIEENKEEIELEDFYNENKPLKISMDTRLSPNENAQKYYKLYNKGKNSIKYAEELSQKVREEINYLENVLSCLNLAENLNDLKEIEQELISQNILKSQTQILEKKPTISLLEYVSSEKAVILVGKNNKQNEHLLKIAQPEDIWLHVQNIAGAHVLVKTPQKPEKITDKTLHEAVYLAVWYSQVKNSSNVPVVYTLRKFVKKPSGSKPGFVVFTNEKTLWANPSEENLPELKKFCQ